MCKLTMSFASLTLLSALASAAAGQFDPVFPGLQISVAPPGSESSFHAIVAADMDLDGLHDLLSLTATPSPANFDQVLGVARGLPGGGYATPGTWIIESKTLTGAMDVADLDGNGWPDVAVTGLHHVTVVYGKSGGLFGFSASYFVSADELYDIELEDIDRDGLLDLVTASQDDSAAGGHVNVNLADGSSGYLATQAWPLAGAPEALACGDLDSDGWLDVVTVGPDAVLQILPSDGAEGFLPTQSLAGDPNSRRVLLGTLDADADLDVVVIAAGQGSGSTNGFVRAWLNDGAGLLAAGTPVHVGRDLSDGLLHDLDADGDLDVVAVDAGKSGYFWAKLVLVDNDAAGGLTLLEAMPLDAEIESAAIGDGTGDGVPDLLLAPAGTSVAVFPSRADGALVIDSQCALVERPLRCAAADLDGDDWLDVVYAADKPTTFATLMGSATGLQQTPVPSPALMSSPVRDLTLGDLSGDGQLDALIVTHSALSDNVQVGPGLGDGTFGGPWTTTYLPVLSASRILAVDLDTDGWLDAALIIFGLPGRVDVFRNLGPALPGHLDDPLPFDCGDAARDAAAADLDGDALTDLAIVRSSGADGVPSTLAILLGDGTGNLFPPMSIGLPAASSDAKFVCLADIDLDGRLDAAVSYSLGDITLVLGDGAGGWLPGAVQPTPEYIVTSAVDVGDVDGDGWPDVVQVGSFHDEVLVRRGDGAGGLLAPDSHCTTGLFYDALLADMNADGKPDLVSAASLADLPFDGCVRVTENVRETFTWYDLGHAKAGPHGQPHLTGTGTLEPGSSGALHLGQAAPAALAALLVSDAEQPLPWKGGVLVPAAPQLLAYAATDTEGRVLMTWTTWATGASGATLVLQFAIADPGAPQGTTLSNALRAAVP